MKYTYLLISVIVFLIITPLFKQAAGTLSLKKLNIISFAYYNLLVFSFIGATVILCGFRDHYLVEKVSSEEVFRKTYCFLIYGLIALPIAILFFLHLFVGNRIRDRYNLYLSEKISMPHDEENAWTFAVLFTVIGTIATMVMFYNMGSFPALSAIRSHSLDSIVRINVTRNYKGNTLIRNVVVLGFTPFISYYTYIYMRTGTQKKIQWTMLFLFNALLSVIIKTYNLEKSPVIYWLFYFYIIEILLGNKKASRYLERFLIVAIVLILFMYSLSGFNSRILSLSSGPLSRILITQPSTLFLHFQAFPDVHPYLDGASLPTAVSWLFRAPESWVRSGRVIMEIYNAKGVAAGEAGVMNAMFMGEAYANWGIPGVLISPIVVAFSLAFTFAILLRYRKTPLTMLLYIALFATLTNSLHGGFVDYIYNSSVIMFVLAAIAISTFLNGGIMRLQKR